jgi:hypothetical protein
LALVVVIGLLNFIRFRLEAAERRNNLHRNNLNTSVEKNMESASGFFQK